VGGGRIGGDLVLKFRFGRTAGSVVAWRSRLGLRGGTFEPQCLVYHSGRGC